MTSEKNHGQNMHEFCNMLADWISAPEKKKEDMILDDSHCHFRRPRSAYELEEILGAIVEKTDRCALTDWGNSINDVLSYRMLKEIIPEYNGKFALEDYGRIVTARRKNDGRQSMLYRAQEIRTKQHLHICAEASEITLKDGEDAADTIKRIHDYEGIATVEHPCSKTHPVKQYELTNEKDDEYLLKILGLADAAEVFNSMNTLWMFRANAKAKNILGEYNKNAGRHVAMVANTDMHFGKAFVNRNFYLRHVGSSGTYYPKRDGKILSDSLVIEMKRSDMKNMRYERKEHYTGPWQFFFEMVPPIIYRKLKIDTDSIS